MVLTELLHRHSVNEDRWLSDIFGHAVFRVIVPRDAESIHADELRKHARLQSPAMYYAKVGTSQVAVLKQLEAAGMNVVDVNVTLSRSSDALTLSSRSRCVVKEALPADEAAVCAIARECFRYSRFHLDPDTPNELADQVKHDWVRNYFRGQRGDRLFVAWRDGRPAGFLQALNTGKTALIDLIGVSSQFQRCGLASSLLQSFGDYYQDRSDVFQVGTQVTNIASLRLYQKYGFEVSDSNYVLHMHT